VPRGQTGNLRYRELVADNKTAWDAASQAGRTAIQLHIYRTMTEVHLARFLAWTIFWEREASAVHYAAVRRTLPAFRTSRVARSICCDAGVVIYHAGNRLFRAFVDSFAARYRSTRNPLMRTRLLAILIRVWKERGGRFLAKQVGGPLYEEDDAAMEPVVEKRLQRTNGVAPNEVDNDDEGLLESQVNAALGELLNAAGLAPPDAAHESAAEPDQVNAASGGRNGKVVAQADAAGLADKVEDDTAEPRAEAVARSANEWVEEGQDGVHSSGVAAASFPQPPFPPCTTKKMHPLVTPEDRPRHFFPDKKQVRQVDRALVKDDPLEPDIPAIHEHGIVQLEPRTTYEPS
jgi:hypothetical protein